MTAVLHTWGQTLTQHPHGHCLVTGGALGANGYWISPRRGFLFPVKALSTVFRGKFLAALKRAFDSGAIALAGGTTALADVRCRAALFADLYRQPWVVYAKRPFAGPGQVLAYLGRDTHRSALTNNRLVSVDDQTVRFRYQDYAAGNRRKVMALDAQEFIRRSLAPVLPKGSMRIRNSRPARQPRQTPQARTSSHRLGLHTTRARRHCTRNYRGVPAAHCPHRHPPLPALRERPAAPHRHARPARPRRSERSMAPAISACSWLRQSPARLAPHSNCKPRCTEPSGPVQRGLSTLLPHGG